MDCCSSFGIVFVGAKEHSHDSVLFDVFCACQDSRSMSKIRVSERLHHELPQSSWV